MDAEGKLEDGESTKSATAKDDDDKEPTAQLEEALDVLIDLVTLTQVVAVNR